MTKRQIREEARKLVWYAIASYLEAGQPLCDAMDGIARHGNVLTVPEAEAVSEEMKKIQERFV